MSQKPSRFLPLLLGLSLFLSMGCGLFQTAAEQISSSSPTPEASTEPTGPEPLSRGDILRINSSNLQSLESYRMSISQKTDWELEGESMLYTEDMEYAIIQPWDAQYFFYSAESQSPEQDGNPFAAYQFGEEFYDLEITGLDNFCYRLPTEQESFDSLAIFNLDQSFESVEVQDLIKSEEFLNDVYTDHYRVTNIRINLADVTQSEGEIWIDRGSGAVVRFIGEAEGYFDVMMDGENGHYEWDYNISEVNTVENIALPEECSDENLTDDTLYTLEEISTEDIPIPENAFDIEIYGDTITFESPDLPSDVAGYYRFELPLNGWGISLDDSEDETLIMMTFEKGERELELVFSFGENDGASVIITEIMW